MNMPQRKFELQANASRLTLATRMRPEAAMGLATARLMVHPAFARAPFGHIARALAGQVNRGHYAFAMRSGQPVGFVGYGLVSEAVGEGWLAGNRAIGTAEAVGGDCLLLNFWQADDAEVGAFLRSALRMTLPAIRRIYAKRHYPDGRTRPVRLELA
ncbi:hypothetical protein [Amaricoccus macauensis]|uniref:hypothetical protein n=1 Tax=Amaricoccus macauensis TaxID=57001 RepID=UPI003C7C0B71